MSRLRETIRGYCYIAPNFLGFALFTALPVLGAIVMSFCSGSFASIRNANGVTQLDARFVGLENYSRLLGFRRVRVLGVLEHRRGASTETLTLIAEPKPDADPAATSGTGEVDSAPIDVLGMLSRSTRPVPLTAAAPTLGFFCGESFVREVQASQVVNFNSLNGSRWQAMDPAFWFYLWNTFIFLVGIPITMACSLGLALLLNQKIRFRVAYRTLLFLPSVATGVALYLVWRWIYNPNVGLLNSGLQSLGLISGSPDWLGDPWLVRPAIIAMGVFTTMGGTNMILFLAGLQGIDPQLFEAAEIDGAGPWARFWHVTWPGLRPTTFFILTTNLIGGFQMFDQAYVMTNGGPEGATTTIVYYIYQQMFQFQKMGYAAAIAIVLFALVFIVTMANWALQKAMDPLAR